MILPILEEISSDLIVTNGSTVILNCKGSALENNVSITWSTSFPGLALPKPTQISLDENTVSSSITLDSVDSSYSGEYVCNVSNELSSVTENISLTIISK